MAADRTPTPVPGRLWACTLAAALALAAAPLHATTDPKAGRFYEDALSRFEKKDYDGAVLQLKNALQIDKTMLPVHTLLGKALLANGEVAAAEAAFTEALRLGVSRSEVVLPLARAVVAQGRQQELVDQPRFRGAGLPVNVQTELLLIKAAAYGDLGDPRSALKAIDEARQLSPGALEAWLAEVPVRIRARQFAQAQAAVDKARSLAPNAAELHYQAGSIAHVQGNLAAALAAYDKALAADPAHVDARVARAGLYIDLKRDADAAKDVARLLEGAPLEPRGWYLSALLAERSGQTATIKDSLHKITELLDPVPVDYVRYRPQLLLLNGQAHYALGEREKAKPLLEAFQRAQPGSPVAKLLASIYLAEGNVDGATAALDQYLQSFPGDTQAMALLASTHMAKGRHARAAALLQEALRTKDAPELRASYGLSLMAGGQTGDALGQLEAAYKKDPGQAQAGFALIGLYLRGNEPAKALAVANALAARYPGNPSAQHLLGLVKARLRDPAGARAAYEKALKIDPTMAAASLSLARLEAQAGNAERAQALLDGVLKAEPRNTDAMIELAGLAERRGQPPEALRWLQKAYDTAGAKDLRASLSLVDLQMRQGRRDEALKLVQQLAAAMPDDLRTQVALARVQLASGDAAGARNALAVANRLAGYDAPAQVEIALLQNAAGNLLGAAYSLDKALSTKPDFLPALVLLTEVETRQGEFAKAEAHAQQVLRRTPREAIGHSLLGDLALARRQPAAAVEAYRRAHQVQPSTETLTRLYGALAPTDAKAAQALAEQWLKGHAGDTAVRRLLVASQLRAGNLAGARQELEKLRQQAPKDAGVLNDLANVLLRLKDPQASAVAEQALALDANNPAVVDTAGWVAFQAGKLDRALQLLRDARLRNPDSAETRYHLAAVLAKSGRKDEAREELAAALRNPAPFDGRDEAQALQRTLN